ncbi:MAG: hypothetical protein ACREIA_15090, partial [Opitutaceae bacterium]
MTTIDLIAAALPPESPPETPREGVCCVTGETGPTIARAHALKPSFTNLDLLRAPRSDRASVAAWRVLNHAPVRQSLWLCDGRELRLLKRTDVRPLVLEGVPGAYPWAGYATTSYKKHGALRAPVNTGSSQRWLFEMRVVDCSDRAAVAATWARLRAAQQAGIPRPLIECLDVSPGHMARIGWRAWREFEAWAR